MNPSDPSMVGRRVGGSFVFYWLNSLITSSNTTARQPHEIPREAPTLLPPEPPPIFANLPPPLAAQLAWQMILVAEKTAAKEARLTLTRKEMAFFSTHSISRPPLGRPLNTPTGTFAALLFAKLSGNSRRRAEEILAKNPDAANGAIWSVAANAAAEGIETAEQFQEWLQREPATEKQSPSV